MELEKLLKKLKEIEPSREFTQQSKLVILATAQNKSKAIFDQPIWRWGVRFSGSLTLVSIFIILIVTGFSIRKTSNYDSLPGFDIKAIKAEAQAIDIQIKLTNLDYVESLITKNPIAGKIKTGTQKLGSSGISKELDAINDLVASSTNETGATTTVMGIDETLQVIAE